MPIPEAGYPRTAAVSPRVQVVETTGSTNADVVAAVTADPAGWPHLSLLVTRDQRAGRGRLDRTWTAPAGTAIAVSVVVDASRVPLPLRGWIPLVAGAAMTRAVRAQLGGHGGAVELKWPNDVLVEGGKICGILAEAVPGTFDTVVVGAGVNTRMSRADLPVATATSFAALGAECDEDQLLADYVSGLSESLAALAAGQEERVHGDVEKLCATVGREVSVSLPDGTTLSGRATRLDETGRLVVEAGTIVEAVSAGDVVHVR
ncbi:MULTISPECIES: biotin--[acetyl-CoA-carboxylase] ligase [Microbacterium]|jgi:BirA family biotin operon repressor/biotin-[acetyl-CoA-carboxylase] ligase|uniref:biotin--[acetyl-CoA-carboxylase] ligase n=1 Tax=Microbacterium TaxID=33882 RepID=UPI00278ADB87|nr:MULTISPECIES: biotin--[acetyl-CoA-carboxylase] ligase [Microbacterium]MDQ1074022.1 BirA family biotin operon repressor/biotin-[acetyl-CoA-carboxylase] ligase [Microbacterium sp. SORGH_AS_0969]MDQ1114249.1 BirA family biotin operon repressor/biotin-[acetyl-CoA-carboxylase] ligase [Microbacterium testaceum]